MKGIQQDALIFYLAAAAAIVVAAAIVAAIATAGEQENQDDDPPAAIPTKSIVTHKTYLRDFLSGITAHSKIFRSNKKVQQLHK